MAWKNLHISRPARLTLRERQLVITQDDDELVLALEDLCTIILDTPQITLTAALLSAFALEGVVVFFPDRRHHPCGVLLPFHAHYAQATVASLQIEASQALKKRLWQAIVRRKITNQASVLEAQGDRQASQLFQMVKHVQSGDPDNLEAQAARLYWGRLFSHFTRCDDGDIRNDLLNYGYAIVRGCLARACVASGLLPVLGLHHQSKTNSFNLADDLIEPFRPFVDAMVCQYVQTRDDSAGGMNVADRRYLTGILQRTVGCDEGVVTLVRATQSCARSLVKAYERKIPQELCLPFWRCDLAQESEENYQE